MKLPSCSISTVAGMVALAAGVTACATQSPQPAAMAPAPTVEMDASDTRMEEPAPLTEAHTVEPEGEIATAPAVQTDYNRDDVVWIQQRLIELGYLDGQADGAVGEQTRSAVRAYQRDQDIEADGKPTSDLREFMWRNGG